MNTMTKDDLPYEGVKVLDLSQGVAGPYCGMHLARNGANVIKVEPTEIGCWSRRLGKHTGDHTAHSVIVNRAKRSLAVDLKTDQGVAIVQRLASQCDVLIHNYRVGKIDKFKLDYESVKQTNPNVIYAHITGFGPKGPRADNPATDSVMQAYTGMMSINCGTSGVPQRIEMLAIDFSTGLYAFQAVAAALYRKAMKGRGAHIQTSLLESALALQEGAMMEHHLQGGAAEPIGMPVGMFKTKDGFMSVNAALQQAASAGANIIAGWFITRDAEYSCQQCAAFDRHADGHHRRESRHRFGPGVGRAWCCRRCHQCWCVFVGAGRRANFRANCSHRHRDAIVHGERHRDGELPLRIVDDEHRGRYRA